MGAAEEDTLARLKTLRKSFVEPVIASHHGHVVKTTGDGLHAAFVTGGRELSTYPDRCVLQLERRTIVGEPPGRAVHEVEEILADCRRDHPDIGFEARPLFERRPYDKWLAYGQSKTANVLFAVASPPPRGFLMQITEVMNGLNLGMRRSLALSATSSPRRLYRLLSP